jgi:hypothetical protein
MLRRILITISLCAAAVYGESPIVCNLNALSPAERSHHAALSRKLAAATVENRELPDGLALRLSPTRMTLAELADWIEAERRCCPFLDFRVSLEREGGAFQLSLSGRPGVKELLQSEFAKTEIVKK